jgi:hypothetical protein
MPSDRVTLIVHLLAVALAALGLLVILFVF